MRGSQTRLDYLGRIANHQSVGRPFAGCRLSWSISSQFCHNSHTRCTPQLQIAIF